jgi:aspartate/methionine/tyrosine aminotransferase
VRIKAIFVRIAHTQETKMLDVVRDPVKEERHFDLSEGLAFFWKKEARADGLQINPLAQRFVSNRAKALMYHPQSLGNYFTYRHAIPVLNIDPTTIFPDGKLTLPERYTDMGYMWSQIGPPESSLQALRDNSNVDSISPYPPDLIHSLRELVAEKKFLRARSPEFDVMGTEGAQGAIGYTFLAYLDPGDEIIITDPAYMHFAPGPHIEGAVVRTIPLGPQNGFRLDPDEVKARINSRTKMLVVCDPLNPFGTVQTKEELIAIADICRRNNVLIFNNFTHNTHRTDPAAQHYPMASLYRDTDVDHVVSCTGVSKGYALAGARLGFLGGHPDLLKSVALLKMEITKIHNNLLGQHASLAAIKDDAYVDHATKVIRRNLMLVREAVKVSDGVTIPVDPQYGFCMCIDVKETGVTAQEVTIALFKQGYCVIPGDALGEVGTTRFIRINYSQADATRLERFKEALPAAIKDAQTGKFAEGVKSFYKKVGTQRALNIIRELDERRK